MLLTALAMGLNNEFGFKCDFPLNTTQMTNCLSLNYTICNYTFGEFVIVSRKKITFYSENQIKFIRKVWPTNPKYNEY